MSNKKIKHLLVLVSAIFIVLSTAVISTSCQKETIPFDALESKGYQGSCDDLIVSLLNESETKKSAYDIATEKGYTSSVDEWLNLLIVDSADNKQCKRSAYEWSLEYGFTGTEEQFDEIFKKSDYDMLKRSSYPLAVDNGFNASAIEWLEVVDNSNVKNGKTLFGLAVDDGYKKSRKDWIINYAINNKLYPNDLTVYELAKIVDSQITTEEWIADIIGNKDLSEIKENLLTDDAVNNTTTSQKSIDPKSDLPTIIVENTTAHSGDKSVQVVVHICNNPGILGMILNLSYDDSILKLKSVKNGEALNEILTMTSPKTFTNGCNFAWDGIELKKNDIKDGSILLLTFDIEEDAQNKVYPIKLTYKNGDIVDNELQDVTVEIINGGIIIK